MLLYKREDSVCPFVKILDTVCEIENNRHCLLNIEDIKINTKFMITQKIKKFQELLPLDEIMKVSIKNFLDVKYNYNSNAIEGTTLSEAETVEILRWNTVPKHSLVEHFEVINHKNAFDFIWELTNWFDKTKNSWKDVFNKQNLFKIHSFILNNINSKNAWNYRRHNVKIAFSRAVLPRWEKIYDLMEDFFEKYLEKYEDLDKNNLEDILKYWYKLHINFVKIHPFIYWNWRTARLLQNLFFLNEINNINIIYFKNRQEYISTIDNYDFDKNKYFEFMNENFSEFKKEELELLKDKIFYKI